MNARSIWSILGIAATTDTTEIRRAYARQLRQTNPEDDQEGFKALREAYDIALRQARFRERAAAMTPSPAVEPAPKELQAAEESAPTRRVEIRRPLPPIAQPTEPARTDRDLVDEAAHAPLCNHLASLVGKDDVAPDDLRDALFKVLNSPAMDSIGVQHRTEAWLGQLIANAPRQCDPLIDLAISHFGWAAWPMAGQTHPGAPALARQEALRMRKGLANLDNLHNPAFQALTRKPTPWRRFSYAFRIGLPAKVDDLLSLLQHRHPGLLGDLNADALAHWRNYLSRPAYGPINVWLALILPPVIAGMTFNAEPGQSASPSFLIRYFACLALVLAAQGLWLFGLARPRARWRTDPYRNVSAWVTLGWAPAALLVLLASSAIPASLLGASVLAPLALAVAGWAYVVGRPDDSFVDGWSLGRPRYLPMIALPIFLAPAVLLPGFRSPWRIRALMSHVYLLAYGAIVAQALPKAAADQMTAPGLAAVFAFVIGARTLTDAWNRLSPKVRRGGLIGLAIGAAVTPALLWSATATAAWAPAAVALTAVMVLLHKTPASRLGKRANLIRDIAMRYGWLVWLALQVDAPFRQSNGAILFGGLWLLTGVAITALGGLRAEWTEAKPHDRQARQ